MRAVISIVLLVFCVAAFAADRYPQDDAQIATKILRGELSIWHGISPQDRAIYEKVKRKLDERTNREADLFFDARERRRWSYDGYYDDSNGKPVGPLTKPQKADNDGLGCAKLDDF